ncbi:MAG: lysophospholipase [Pedobacter sp.]|jgi:lysophospholipase L1-like esterase|nr:lysophospholipase [Pedobacter sp.]
MKILATALSLFLLMACDKSNSSSMTQELSATTPVKTTITSPKLTYLALGDSYTIGEAVTQAESFPFQLAADLRAKQFNVATPKIIAKTGWTTSELQQGIKASGVTGTFSFVTLLIGVNNQYRGQSKDTYRTQFKQLLQTAITFAAGKKAHVFVVSIPDWGLTPFGKKSGRNQKAISADIDAFNAINKQETLAAGISYTNITPASRLVVTDLSLVASDGLHPSGKMYAGWGKALTTPIAAAFTTH